MFFLHLIKIFLFFLGLMILGWDLTQSLHAGKIVLSPIGEHWFLLEKNSLLLFQNFIQRYVSQFLWDYFIQNCLLVPTTIFNLIVLIILILLPKLLKNKINYPLV
tara:strand:+ start:39 stop:353 length:315 start_codon:yes stop_codon:yes gene_type:complete